jgi:hypothetical protein
VAVAGREYPHDYDYYTERQEADGSLHIDHCDAPILHTQSRIADGCVEVVVQGRAPQNELDTPETCRRLAGALTLRDEKEWWVDEVRPRPSYVDGYLCCGSLREPVGVQATIVDLPGRLRSLNTTGQVLSTLTFAEAAAEIWAAIQKKQRWADPRMVLALRGHAGIHPLRDVVEEFHRTYGATLHNLGWKEIWLIGASPEVCFCLWPRPSSDMCPAL